MCWCLYRWTTQCNRIQWHRHSHLAAGIKNHISCQLLMMWSATHTHTHTNQFYSNILQFLTFIKVQVQMGHESLVLQDLLHLWRDCSLILVLKVSTFSLFQLLELCISTAGSRLSQQKPERDILGLNHPSRSSKPPMYTSLHRLQLVFSAI